MCCLSFSDILYFLLCKILCIKSYHKHIKKDIKNINIDIFDQEGKRIIDESVRDGLSIIERAGLSNISLESFEKDGKLFLKFNGIQKDQEIDLEISIESEDIYDIEQILDIEYME